jgi:hypothetical protein
MDINMDKIMKTNTFQKIVLIVYVLVLLIIFLYPPCLVEFLPAAKYFKFSFLEYRSLFKLISTPEKMAELVDNKCLPQIYSSLLLIEILVSSLIAFSLMILFNNFKKPKIKFIIKKKKNPKKLKTSSIDNTTNNKNRKIIYNDKEDFVNKYEDKCKEFRTYSEIMLLYDALESLIQQKKNINLQKTRLFKNLIKKKNKLISEMKMDDPPDIIYL